MVDVNVSIEPISEAPCSPCVRRCCLNAQEICIGCGRSLFEITHWTQVDKRTQQQFSQNAYERKQALER